MEILFIEDRELSILEAIDICEKRGHKCFQVRNATGLYNFLKKNISKIGLIVIDIMLRAIPNLEEIDIESSDTQGGYEAGWVIIDRILRPLHLNKDLIDKCDLLQFSDQLFKIPIVILSTRSLSKDDIGRFNRIVNLHKSKTYPDIRYIEKDAYDQDGKPFILSFKEVLEQCEIHYKSI